MKNQLMRKQTCGRSICLDPASYGLFVASISLFSISFVFYFLSFLSF